MQAVPQLQLDACVGVSHRLTKWLLLEVVRLSPIGRLLALWFLAVPADVTIRSTIVALNLLSWLNHLSHWLLHRFLLVFRRYGTRVLRWLASSRVTIRLALAIEFRICFADISLELLQRDLMRQVESEEFFINPIEAHQDPSFELIVGDIDYEISTRTMTAVEKYMCAHSDLDS